MNRKVTILLNELEKELKNTNLWETKQPSIEKLTSTLPFCCDTLNLNQWLEFIFIPKIKVMLAKNLPLPINIAICPMAEESFKYLGNNARKLINIIADIDELLSGKCLQTRFL